MLDKMLIRSYTPTRPITESDDNGTFELTVKTYFPDDNQPGGAFSNFLLELPIGEEVEVCGPTGEIEYLGQGKFDIEGEEKQYKKISLVLGGSGLTPGFALIERIAREKDNVQVKVIDANKTEDDILCRDKLNEAVHGMMLALQRDFLLTGVDTAQGLWPCQPFDEAAVAFKKLH